MRSLEDTFNYFRNTWLTPKTGLPLSCNKYFDNGGKKFMRTTTETTTHTLELPKSRLKELLVEAYGPRWKNAEMSLLWNGRSIRGVELRLTEEVKSK